MRHSTPHDRLGGLAADVYMRQTAQELLGKPVAVRPHYSWLAEFAHYSSASACPAIDPRFSVNKKF